MNNEHPDRDAIGAIETVDGQGQQSSAIYRTAAGVRRRRGVARLAPLPDGLDDIAHHIDGTFVVVVAVAAGTYRRRCFLSVRAAESAARRAADRGETATVYLAELRPLWKVCGGGS